MPRENPTRRKPELMVEKKPAEQLLTVGESARLLGRSPESVREYEKRGLLSALKTQGGMRLFRREDVENFKKQWIHKGG
jgi:excisionase family DNA binding protein